jgi:hypothetical protein
MTLLILMMGRHTARSESRRGGHRSADSPRAPRPRPKSTRSGPNTSAAASHGNLHLLLELPRTYEREAARALRANAYDVVHVNQPHGFHAARAVHRIAPRAVFIHRSHGFELNVEETLAPWRAKFGFEERSLVRRAVSRVLARGLARHSHAIAREADGHIVSSTLDAEYLAERLHVDRANRRDSAGRAR